MCFFQGGNEFPMGKPRLLCKKFLKTLEGFPQGNVPMLPSTFLPKPVYQLRCPSRSQRRRAAQHSTSLLTSLLPYQTPTPKPTDLCLKDPFLSPFLANTRPSRFNSGIAFEKHCQVAFLHQVPPRFCASLIMTEDRQGTMMT